MTAGGLTGGAMTDGGLTAGGLTGGSPALAWLSPVCSWRFCREAGSRPTPNPPPCSPQSR